MRFDAHRMQFQGSGLFAEVLRQEVDKSDIQLFNDILDWAEQPGQPSDQLKSGIVALSNAYSTLPEPVDALYADREAVREVILEKEPLSNPRHEWAAILNRLPGEQTRAIEALDTLSALMQKYVFEVQESVAKTSAANNRESATQLRELLRAAPWTGLYAVHESMYHGDFASFRMINQLADACATSFLVNYEFRSFINLRNLLQQWVETETHRRALLVQIALLAYRIDHSAYPETLAELTPEYLAKDIFDPYSGSAFIYQPGGLELPLMIRNYQDGPDRHEIPASTPLLWSVGLSNSRLEEVADFLGDDMEYGGGSYLEDSPNKLIEMGGELKLREPDPTAWREMYVLQSTEGGNFAYNNLVFPLPKIDEDESETTPQPDGNAEQGNSDSDP
jgi:hypothetical protein